MAKSDYYRIGARVRLQDKPKPRASWKQYNGKIAVVIGMNRRDGEIQVKVENCPATWVSHNEVQGVV